MAGSASHTTVLQSCFSRRRHRRAFTLIELLIVVAILAILAAIAVPNLREAMRRSETASCAANMKAIATALIFYRADWNKFPLSDGIAGTHDSRNQTQFGNGPAANGYWNGVPNALVTLGYLGNRKSLFCPSLAKQHKARAEHLRYAYNAASLDSNSFLGSDGTPIDGLGAGGRAWVVRCVHVNAQLFAPERTIAFPHGPDPDPTHDVWGDENVLWSDFSVTREPGHAP